MGIILVDFDGTIAIKTNQNNVSGIAYNQKLICALKNAQANGDIIIGFTSWSHMNYAEKGHATYRNSPGRSQIIDYLATQGLVFNAVVTSLTYFSALEKLTKDAEEDQKTLPAYIEGLSIENSLLYLNNYFRTHVYQSERSINYQYGTAHPKELYETLQKTEEELAVNETIKKTIIGLNNARSAAMKKPLSLLNKDDTKEGMFDIVELLLPTVAITIVFDDKSEVTKHATTRKIPIGRVAVNPQTCESCNLVDYDNYIINPLLADLHEFILDKAGAIQNAQLNAALENLPTITPEEYFSLVELNNRLLQDEKSNHCKNFYKDLEKHLTQLGDFLGHFDTIEFINHLLLNDRDENIILALRKLAQHKVILEIPNENHQSLSGISSCINLLKSVISADYKYYPKNDITLICQALVTEKEKAISQIESILSSLEHYEDLAKCLTLLSERIKRIFDKASEKMEENKLTNSTIERWSMENNIDISTIEQQLICFKALQPYKNQEIIEACNQNFTLLKLANYIHKKSFLEEKNKGMFGFTPCNQNESDQFEKFSNELLSHYTNNTILSKEAVAFLQSKPHSGLFMFYKNLKPAESNSLIILNNNNNINNNYENFDPESRLTKHINKEIATLDTLIAHKEKIQLNGKQGSVFVKKDKDKELELTAARYLRNKLLELRLDPSLTSENLKSKLTKIVSEAHEAFKGAFEKHGSDSKFMKFVRNPPKLELFCLELIANGVIGKTPANNQPA